jgi:hypothetical protein
VFGEKRIGKRWPKRHSLFPSLFSMQTRVQDDLSGVAATNLQRGKENSSGSTVKMASLFVTPLK